MLLNEGAGAVFEYGGQRRYGVCCAEKGIFRFNLTALGAAGHASMPRTGDNALLKLAPVAHRAGRPARELRAHRGARGAAGRTGRGPRRPVGRAGADRAPRSRALRMLVEPMLGVTLTPTMASASTKMNVIPARAQLRIDCRVPPGLGEDAARRRIAEVLGEPSDELRDRVHRAGGRQRARRPRAS